MPINFDAVEFDTGNPESRCPCVLLLDTSGSMGGAPIAELNAGLQTFKDALSRDALAMLRVEVAIITFGPVRVIQDFITANQFSPPMLHTEGDTPMGTAINLAIDKLNDRKQIYRRNGISYYRPWIFLVTDGAPTDKDVWPIAAQRIQQEESKKKIAFFAVGVEGANMEILSRISGRQPLKLQNLDFREMFVWLSSSLAGVSRSRPGQEVPLQSPIGWGNV